MESIGFNANFAMKNQGYSIFFSLSKIIFYLFIIAIINAVGKIAIAEAVTTKCHWVGEKGYSAEIIFSYDEQLMPSQM